MHIRTNRFDGSHVLHMKGEVTLQDIVETKKVILDSLCAASSVVLDLREVSDIDLPCLQLLCSAHRTSVKLGKSITFSGELSDSFMAVVEKAGYRRTKGCALDVDDTCLWKEVTHG
jgi:anti-anti-sigma regulatory factor